MLTTSVINEFINLSEDFKFMYEAVAREMKLKSYNVFIYSSMSYDIINQFSEGIQADQETIENIVATFEEKLIPKPGVHNSEYFHLTEAGVFGEPAYEAVLVVYSQANGKPKIIGINHFAVEKEDGNKLEEFFMSSFKLESISNSTYLLQLRLDIYERLFSFIDVFSELLTIKDKFMPFHITNVANWCNKISDQIGLSSKEETILYLSALLHDVGKTFISESIINKPGKLTDEEYEVIKNHSVHGYDISLAELSGLPVFECIPTIVRAHHEKFDGSGYPDGLKNDEIPKLSRILSICDTIDAMLSRRSYKDRNSFNEVIKEIKRCSGTQFDPTYVENAIRMLEDNKRDLENVSISKMNFIPLAALTFYEEDVIKPRTFRGNLVICEMVGKLIVHSKEVLQGIDTKRINKARISFFNNNDISEYEVSVIGLIGNQLILSEMLYVPLDKYFSLVWELSAQVVTDSLYNVEIIKIGGDQLMFQTDVTNGEALSSTIGKTMNIKFELEISGVSKVYDIQIRLMQYYQFIEKHVFACKYENISTPVRDSIIKMIFKKHVNDRLQK